MENASGSEIIDADTNRERSAERPKRMVVDGLWTYEKGFKKVFYNNINERLHGTLKDRSKHLKGLKSEETVKVW